MPQLDTLARRDTKQVCGAPDDVAFERAHASVSIDNLPHHLDDAAVSLIVDQRVNRPGEVIEVDRLTGCFCPLRDQLDRASSQLKYDFKAQWSLLRRAADISVSILAARMSSADVATRHPSSA